MIRYIDDLEQGTPQWLKERMGIMTASVVKNLLTSRFQISRDQKVKLLALDMAAQRITQKVVEMPRNSHMERGHIEEDLAKAYYHRHYHETHDCGFIVNDDLGFKFGFSPDGLVGEDGFIEVKSRLPKYQVKTILHGEIPDDYIVQVQTGFLATKRKWCDFIQFSNGMPMFVKRAYPDPEMMGTISEALAMFESSVVEAVNKYEENAKDLVDTEFTKHDYATQFVGDDTQDEVFK